MGRKIRVGVFDSGVGGLCVLRECIKICPQFQYYYYGDNDRAPYGDRAEGEIICFTREALSEFLKWKVDAVVIACNTATAVCVDKMRGEFPFPIFGIEPAIKPASLVCGRAIVLATTATIKSERLKRLIEKFGKDKFILFPARGLAEAVENMWRGGENVILQKYLPVLSLDGVVLGCTHYSFLREKIQEFYGVSVFDGAEGVARRLYCFFNEKEKKTSKILMNVGTNDHQKEKMTTNKCLKISNNKINKNDVIFVNSTKIINKNIYKQMFACSK